MKQAAAAGSGLPEHTEPESERMPSWENKKQKHTRLLSYGQCLKITNFLDLSIPRILLMMLSLP